MAKFNASTAVERLEYDFTEYGGGEGVIPEPTTDAINHFFNEVKGIMKDTKAVRELMAASENGAGDISDEDAAVLLESVGDASEFTTKMQFRMVEAVAVLCGGTFDEGQDKIVGGQPSVDDLRGLPFRVAQAFNQWLMGELRPKAATPGTKH